MLELLTQTEKDLTIMLIQGQNFNGISYWLSIDRKEYLKIKRSVFKKLKITKAIQILPTIIEDKLFKSHLN